ncbi:MAG: AAA family ATPase [Chitinophagales bacterium]|nr:AAA family ATPase [Chitinophagales bacterium]
MGRIIVLTGARQIGKTVCAKQCFDDYAYLSIEDPIKRSSFLKLSTEQWETHYPKAILDEVQKEPQLIESIKSVYDQYSNPRYALLSSSQFLLLHKVRESLAGRCVILEMFPLTLPEMLTENEHDPVLTSFLIDFLNNKSTSNKLLPSFILDGHYAQKITTYHFYQTFGGYPFLTHSELNDDERYIWLSNYVKTYLERDIRDLANFRDLESFIKLQNYLANLSGKIVNYSSVAKEAGISVPTVKRYIQYMEISYQTITLNAWSKNPLKRLIKSPKIHFVDYGVLQAILQKKGLPSGNEFESMIVSEIYKQIKTYQLPVKALAFKNQRKRNRLTIGKRRWIYRNRNQER